MTVHQVTNSLGNSCVRRTKQKLTQAFKQRLCPDCVQEATASFHSNNNVETDLLDCLLLTDCGMKWTYQCYSSVGSMHKDF